ncbi:hypothetical protein [Candidatus Nitrosotenuis sp. DW1]|uniref:hypothetical protein n=1 Tax=Candidatus Nitrosotenuis sp. DW1 TaxID=2259672 RepID=UPI0015CA1648|nr:hypothetical protein [Candidatus Nitrosotenuis sp. DW1]QLH09488.1 hypothetical protein DSQ19_08375 [Candidatus Nitrosotenuis sp. DW1]
MKVQIVCQDKHEAVKLASLIFIKDGMETFIRSVVNVYGNELVISLKDKSVHSIVLKDTAQVEAFTDFIQSVVEGESRITDTKAAGDTVEITKD